MHGLVVAWVFGRLGCTFAHDHPGILTEFSLGVSYPDGVRHDLGFYEFLFTLGVLLPSIVFIDQRRLPDGATLAIVPTLYGIARFCLDFLRVDEIRPGGLTVSQYLSLAMVAFGVVVLARLRGRRATPTIFSGETAAVYKKEYGV